MNSQAIGATEATQQSVLSDLDILQMLKRLIVQGQSNAVVDSQRRQRIMVDSLATGLTLSTVSTVGSISAAPNLLGWDQRQIAMQSRLQFAQCIRTKLN